MDKFLLLLVLPTLLQLECAVSEPASLIPVLDLVAGESRIFSGETLQLRCIIPDPYNSTWRARWIHEGNQLRGSGLTLTLRNAHVKQSGKYYCQGTRDTIVGIIETNQSLPAEIIVDGGFAILQAPRLPTLVGEDLTLTCRVLRSPRVKRVILYKDGVEVMTQMGSPHLILGDVTLEDKGMYHCRVSWDTQGRTVEVISEKTFVQVKEVMTKPILQIITKGPEAPANMIKIVCLHEYNARPPAPPVIYYFYRNQRRLGTAQSNNYDLVNRVPGQYSCKAKVSALRLDLLSDPQTYA